MIKVLAFFILVTNAHAYVPTVESLFRHGSNPDVVANGVVLTLSVKKVQPGESADGSTHDVSLLKETRPLDFYKVFFTKTNDITKVAQARYNNSTLSEASLIHKIYYPNFTAHTIQANIEAAEKGVFFGLLQSLALNDGSHLIGYLKSLGVPVKLNSEIINRDKIDFLANYKRYLVTIEKDRNARKTEVNPMRPEDADARERAGEIMSASMYVDTNQVKIAKDEGRIAWMVNAGSFEGVVSYKERDVQKIKYNSAAGEFEVICKDYWLANGTHALPRYMLIKTFNGQLYEVEVTNLRHFIEKEEDLVNRLRNWDQILKGKESTEMRPEFLL